MDEFWTFIGHDSTDAATKFIRQLEKHIRTLERFPARCPLIPENEVMHTAYRHLIHGNYRVIIRISEKIVWLVRIVHGARLLDVSMLEPLATE